MTPHTLQIEYQRLQPGRRVLTDPFLVACGEPGVQALSGAVYSQNLPEPMAVCLEIKFNVTVQAIDVDRFLDWARNPAQAQDGE